MPVYKDENRKGFWKVRLSYTDWDNARKNITKRGFTSKHEAARWETDYRLKLSGNLDMTFEDFVEVYKKDCFPRIRKSTVETKENIIDNKILPYFKTKKLCEITTGDILQWQNTMLKETNPATRKPYSKSYLKTIHNQISAIMNHAMRYYNLKENPAKIVGNMGSEKDIKMQFWTQEQYQQFAEVIMDDPQAYYCFEMLYWTGIRKGELLALTREDIDLDKKTVTINKTLQFIKGEEFFGEPKTLHSYRAVVMPDFLCEELEDYFKMYYDLQPTDRVFPVAKWYLNKKLVLGSKKADLPRIRVHDLRHSHVSLLINMGFSAVAIAERIGHESIDITYRYAHMFPSVQSEMGRKLDDLRKTENAIRTN